MTRRVEKRLRQLTERWALPEGAEQRLSRILDLVQREPSSITAVRDPAHGVDRHIADSLAGLQLAPMRTAARIADLGAGGGFPGLVLAVALPGTQVTLVESVRKKCEFLLSVVDDLELRNVAVVTARAEAWPEGSGSQDVVTARALAPLNVLVEYAAPLLREGGSLVAWKGKRDLSEEADGLHAAEILGLAADPVSPYAAETFSGADARHLYVYLKVRATPSKYPRREGMARKRPLRSSTAA
jgi:16S rRNA (guanine527-N7)-methyltransferase